MYDWDIYNESSKFGMMEMIEVDKIIKDLIENYPKLEVVEGDIKEAVKLLINAFDNGAKLLLCGNGGSATDCEHIVGELLKRFQCERRISDDMKQKLIESGANDMFVKSICEGLPSISLINQVGYLTAYMNDEIAEYMYAQELYVLGKANDVLLAITTSGNSANIVNAAIVARAKNIKVITLTGRTGGKMRKYSDVLINVPEDKTSRIQEYHLPIYHAICAILEKHYYGGMT